MGREAKRQAYGNAPAGYPKSPVPTEPKDSVKNAK